MHPKELKKGRKMGVDLWGSLLCNLLPQFKLPRLLMCMRAFSFLVGQFETTSREQVFSTRVRRRLIGLAPGIVAFLPQPGRNRPTSIAMFASYSPFTNVLSLQGAVSKQPS